MIVVSVSAILKLNMVITGDPVSDGRADRVKSCLSTYHYYDNVYLMISSIVGLLVKNHYFVDGNKRTACAVLLSLCDLNDIVPKWTQEDLCTIMVRIAEQPYNVQRICKMLFGELDD